MRILGISAQYHDSAAALIDDGIPVAMALEERFTRIKHDASFPKNAIDYCLREGKSKKIDFVVFYEKPFLKFERFILSSLSFFPNTRNLFRVGMLSWLKQKMWIKAHISDYLNVEDNKILFIPHHLSHAAASFFSSPFDEAAIISVDGVGEYTTTAVGYGCGTDIKFSRQLQFPHSIGLLYSTFTGYLGFQVNDGEYKLMGLAPYGKPNFMEQMNKIIDIKNDGSYRLNLDYFSYHKSSELPYNENFLSLFGQPRDKKMGHQFTQRHADIASSVQKITEDVLIKLTNFIANETNSKNLCIAGGVGLNSVANYKILKSGQIENIFIQPASGDAGGALGAALYVYHSLLNNPRKFIMNHSYYGQQYSNNEIKDYLNKSNIQYQEYSDNEIIQYAAEEIDKGKILGLFQGKSEWGPRALGNRSIIADARKKEMLNKVNLIVKFRESFRPFAPSVLYEDAENLFEIPRDQYPSKFMLYVCPVQKNIIDRGLLPAVTHVDGSARPQVVTKDGNIRYYQLLEKFKEFSSMGCFLNTSFNLSGEPIVETPQDAYNSFVKTKIDHLILENYVIDRPK